MSIFCPDGYVATPEAICEAVLSWHAERFAGLETSAAAKSSTKEESYSGVEALARALSRPPPISWEMQQLFSDVGPKTVHRLRNLLHEGNLLTAYYFGGLFSEGRSAVNRNFWATAEADGVLESGIFFPFGKPTRSFERRLDRPLFFLKAELDAVLNERAHVLAPSTTAQSEPPGRKPGQVSPKDLACRLALSVLNDETKRPPRGHGRLTRLAQTVQAALQGQDKNYAVNSIEKSIRESFKEWEAANPDN